MSEKHLCDILPSVNRSDSSVMLTCFTVTETFLRKNALLKANVRESSSEWLPINPTTKINEETLYHISFPLCLRCVVISLLPLLSLSL